MNEESRKQKNSNRLTVMSRFMRYLVENAYSFTVAVMGLVHATLAVIFLAAGVWELVQFNVVSVIIYVFCFILCRLGHILPVYASIILEVSVYSVISTYYVGLRCGTYCFLFSIVPIIIYFGSSLFKGTQRWGVVVMLILNFLMFAVLYASFFETPPVYTVPSGIMLILVILSSFAMAFSTLFYNAMYIFSSENQMNILEQKNKQLSAVAHEDALTSLLNRRGFLPLVRKLMEEPGNHFSIAFCDLDDFKRINDSYGHEAGDEVLKHVTTMIKRELPGCDICRWGGEEFVILLNGCDLLTAKGQVERLRKSIESNPTSFFGKNIFVTTTIGLEENKDTYSTPEDIINVADSRMYYGKQHGKNILVTEDN
ncbi:MAG: GGDEF domain-containing protein [Saccharofermentans sp.]|nr:GGDEF domain-containing protein [Saccharofermentans sp.]